MKEVLKLSLFAKMAIPTVTLMIVVAVIYFAMPTVQTLMTLWMLCWLLGFYWLLAAQILDLSTRGFIFVAYSAGLGVGGKALFDETFWVSEAIMQLMLVLGGGIGAGLMADYIIKHDEPKDKGRLGRHGGEVRRPRRRVRGI